MTQTPFTYRELSLAQIHPAADHRREEEKDLEASRLHLLSIKELGILNAIAVCDVPRVVESLMREVMEREIASAA